MGFLSTEDQTVPGNIGFKDQNFILKWIQENIEHFGGDKNSVTIWGGRNLNNVIDKRIYKIYFLKNPLEELLFIII